VQERGVVGPRFEGFSGHVECSHKVPGFEQCPAAPRRAVTLDVGIPSLQEQGSLIGLRSLQ
jgi:hypothetical protein